MRVLIAVSLFFATLTGCGKVVPRDGQIAVVPAPRQVEAEEGCFELTASTPICLLADDSTLKYAADAFVAATDSLFGRALKISVVAEPQSRAVNIRCEQGAMPEESYTLTVTSDRIDLLAGSAAGAFYGVQTLRQLIPQAAWSTAKVRAVELPAATITDTPAMAYRGMMLDAARHFFTVEEVKKLLDIMALHKLNRFHWHLTDDQGWRIEIRKYPKLTEIGSIRLRTLIGKDPGGEYDETCQYDQTPHGGFYTQDDIREVVDYAARRFITVIPEIEFPGHAVAALASYPWLGCTGEQYEVRQTWDIDDRVFCVGKEPTFGFMEDVLSEVVELFPSEYIHIGGDECPTKMWEKCPDCRALMKAEGMKTPRGVQNYATARIERFLNTHGRKLIGWDEILEGEVTPTATIMSWRGKQGGIQAAKGGNQAIMSPSEYCYFDYYQSENREAEPLAWGGYVSVEKVYSLDPYEGLTPEEQRCVLGVQANLWTEYIPTLSQAEYMLLPRLSALAEVAWNPDLNDYADYLRRMDNLRTIYDACGYRYAEHIFNK